MSGNGNFALYDSARARMASAKRRGGGAQSTRPRTSLSRQPLSNTRADDLGRSAHGSLGCILCIRLRSVHLVAHFFHLTKNTKRVGSENLFDFRRAIAAVE